MANCTTHCSEFWIASCYSGHCFFRAETNLALVSRPGLMMPTNSKPALQDTIMKLVHNIPHLAFIISTLVLVIFITIASFIDASVLFAAFIAGGLVNFLWDVQNDRQPNQSSDGSPTIMYKQYYKPLMEFGLVPFFFVSLKSTPCTAQSDPSHPFRQIHFHLATTLHISEKVLHSKASDGRWLNVQL